MDIQTILKVLKNERDCIKRRCDLNLKRNCMECSLCSPEEEALAVYNYLISGYELTEIPISVSKEEAETLLALLKRSRFAVYPVPDVGENYPTLTVTTPNEYGREHFKGICPYTDKKCDTWTCGICEVEGRERKFMEGDND